MNTEFSFEHNRMSSPFGPRRAPTAGASSIHKGEDYATPVGTPITAAHVWTVTATGSQRGKPGTAKAGQLTGWGHWAVLASPAFPGITVRLAHLSAEPSRGVRAPGQTIAVSGNTGTSSGAHVHLEVLVKGKAVDPAIGAPWRRRAVVTTPTAPPPLLARPAQPTSGAFFVYVVQPGDTMWELATSVGRVPGAARARWIAQVKADNHLPDAALIRAGSRLRIRHRWDQWEAATAAPATSEVAAARADRALGVLKEKGL